MLNIFNEQFIDTAVQVGGAMIFIFALLGIIVTQLSTVILGVLNLRAKQLREAIQIMVTDKEFLVKLLGHPMIQLIQIDMRPDEKLSPQAIEEILMYRLSRVSYVPPDLFVEALLSVLMANSDMTLFAPLEKALETLPNNDQKIRLRNMVRDLQSFGGSDINTLRTAILELPDETHKQVLSNELENIENALRRVRLKSGQLVPLLEGVRKVQNSAFRSAIETILASAESMEDARFKLQVWFNYYLDRASDVYRNKLQLLALVISLLLAVFINVDSLYMISLLWENPKTSEAISTTAQSLNAQANMPGDGNTAQVPPTPALPEATAEPNAVPGPTYPIVSEQARAIEDLLQLQLPLGWEYIPITDELVTVSQLVGLPNPLYNRRNSWNFLPGNNPNWLGLLLQKILGLFVTTIVVAQFAPFLFDLMRRLTGSGSSEPAPPAPPTVNVHVSTG